MSETPSAAARTPQGDSARDVPRSQPPADRAWYVSTGDLPASPRLQELVEAAHQACRDDHSGEISQVYPVLAAAAPGQCCLAVTAADLAVMATAGM